MKRNLRTILSWGWVITVGLCSLVARADDNAWINPGGGRWEDASNWSGGLPNSNWYMVITNAGWKAVTIGADTANYFPATMNVKAVTVTSPPDSFNLLLLNYSGYSVPFTANEILINSNAAMTVLGSAIQVTNMDTAGTYRMEIGGTVNHGDFSSVNTIFLSLGNVGPGVYNLTNGQVVGTTEYLGGTYIGRFNQYGGYHWSDDLRILGLGRYELSGGSLGGYIELYYGGVLRQSDGFCNAPIRFDGNFILDGGTYTNDAITIPPGFYDSGSVTQHAGTNVLGALNLGGLGDLNYNYGSYLLGGGWLETASTTIGGYGQLSQPGGTHIVHGTLMVSYGWQGKKYIGLTPIPGRLAIDGGYTRADALYMEWANFEQSAGTVEITGTVTCQNVNSSHAQDSGYVITGGSLACSDFIAAASVTHSGGLLSVTNSMLVFGSILWFDPANQYNLTSNAVLQVPSLRVGGLANFNQAGGTILGLTNITLSSGTWIASVPSAQLPVLTLAADNTGSDSFLRVGPATTVQFANSAAVPWTNTATLTIRGWIGLVNGGGACRILFGVNGLTPQQVSQIRFQDPGGVASGLYPARLLATGELVPDRYVQSKTFGNTLVLNWANGAVLQTATNVAGPYSDLIGITAPFTNTLPGPIRFFRARY